MARVTKYDPLDSFTETVDDCFLGCWDENSVDDKLQGALSVSAEKCALKLLAKTLLLSNRFGGSDSLYLLFLVLAKLALIAVWRKLFNVHEISLALGDEN